MKTLKRAALVVSLVYISLILFGCILFSQFTASRLNISRPDIRWFLIDAPASVVGAARAVLDANSNKNGSAGTLHANGSVYGNRLFVLRRHDSENERMYDLALTPDQEHRLPGLSGNENPPAVSYAPVGRNLYFQIGDTVCLVSGVSQTELALNSKNQCFEIEGNEVM